MLLRAVIHPPRVALDSLVREVTSVRTPDTELSLRPPPPRFLRRRAHGAAPEPVSAPPASDQLDLVPTGRMSLFVAGFGNVTQGDASRLAATLTAAAVTWPRPRVHFTGGTALETPDDRCVWAKLEGDVPGLVAVAKAVTQSVESRGFFVDRRRFRPWVPVATITESTTAPFLEEVVATLDTFRGASWTVECVLVTKPSFDDAESDQKEVYRIPLGVPDPAG